MRLGINARFLAAPVTGVQRFAREVTDRLVRSRDVVLFTPHGAPVPVDWSDQARVVCGRLRGWAWEQLELPRAAATGCDVLLHPANTAPLMAHARGVLMLHDVFPLTHPEWYSPAFAAAYRVLIPRVARRAALLLTTSQHSARALESVLRVPASHLRAVPQGVAPFDRPAAPGHVSQALAALHVTPPYVLVMGAGDARKNTGFARAVLTEYARRSGEAPLLVMVGAPARGVAGRAAESGHGVSGRAAVTDRGVIATGRVDDATLHALYTGAAALLSPTLDEGLGRAPLEALCCGTPCIVSAHGAAAEVLAGTNVPLLPLDAATWADALADVLQRGERVDDTVRALLLRRWSWDAAAEAVLAACDDVLASAQAEPVGAA